MQTNGQFAVPPPDVPPQYNPVNNNVTHNSNNSSRAPGSNQTLGHMLFNLSNQDVSLSPSSSTFTTNPSPPAHSHPNVPPVLLGNTGPCDTAGTKLAQDVAAQQHLNANHQFSNFLLAPRTSSLGHSPRRDGLSMDLSKDLSSAENLLVHKPEQQIMQENSTSNVPLVNANAQTLAPASTSTLLVTSSVQAQTPAIAPHTHVVLGSGLVHMSDQINLENGEGQKQAPEAMKLHHHQQQQLSLGLDKTMNLPASNTNPREMQANADLMAVGDIDQGDEGACAGNRWPRQETIALLKIRADMDAAFRDTSVKRPLWDEVSRKLGELGFERSAKKCKEKFENVNKYYKRTKEGRVGRQDGKNYRFFTQLEALYAAHNNSITSTSAPNMISSSNMLITHTPDPILTLQASARAASSLLQSSALAGNPPPDHPTSTAAMHALASSAPLSPASQIPGLNPAYGRPHLDGNMGTSLHSSSQSSSSDNDEDDDPDEDDDDDVTNEDDDDDHRSSKPHPDAPHDPSHALPPPGQSKKRKRKSSSSMMAFFEGLLKRVIDKQEQMQQKFLQAMEKRESDRMIREEAWRRQEMARLSKEHELRAHERSSAAARDAALIAFLQKVTGQTLDLPTVSMSLSIPIAAQPVQSAPPLLHQEYALHRYEDHDASDPSSKRWLKPEVLHLIELHSSLQAKFTETGPKGPLWEEIANGMAKRGYPSRTAKRCKEKWENINKYFKRAKESSKKRPENAKTCPYFHELDALYRKGSESFNNGNQLSYKPSIELAQHENAAHQPFPSNGQGDLDGTRSLQIQPANVSIEQAEVCDASNTNDTAANQNRSDMGDAMRNTSSSNGILQNIGSMHLSMDKFCSLNTASTSEHTAQRSGFITKLGLSMQQQPSPLDICPLKPVNQTEVEKLNAGGEHMASGITEIALQSCTAKETKPSLAPLPNSTSFMANMLQSVSSNNILAKNNQQDQ